MNANHTGRMLGIAVVTLAVACSSNGTSPRSTSLTIKGGVSTNASTSSVRFAAGTRAHGGQSGPGVLTGDPAALPIGMYALYISPNPDCSNYTLVEDYGTQAAVKDFLQNPTLFSGSPAAGSYSCVGVKLSDVITFRPKSTFGFCDSTVTYKQDIYRADNVSSTDSSTYWRDIDMHAIAAHGTDAVPVDDHVLILFTRDTAAALHRGFNSGQTIQLGASLVVPGSQKFIWGGAGTVLSDSSSASCGINPGQPTFE